MVLLYSEEASELIRWGEQKEELPAVVKLFERGGPVELLARVIHFSDESFTLVLGQPLKIGQRVGLRIRLQDEAFRSRTGFEMAEGDALVIKSMGEVIGEEHKLELRPEFRYTLRFFGPFRLTH